MRGLQLLESALAEIFKQFFRQEAEFCLLAGHMHLHQHTCHHSGAHRLTVDALKQMLGVDTLYEGHTPHELTHLIGLQVADEVPLYVRGQRTAFLKQLLDPALAKFALSCGICLLYGFGRMKFGYRHKAYAGRHLALKLDYALSYLIHN